MYWKWYENLITLHCQTLMSRSGSPGGSSCAEPVEQLVCNSGASEIYGARVIPAPSLHAGVACTSSGCNRCVSVAHTFLSLELFFLQVKNFFCFLNKITIAIPRLKYCSAQRSAELELKLMNVSNWRVTFERTCKSSIVLEL